jgi:hypothetical protein
MGHSQRFAAQVYVEMADGVSIESILMAMRVEFEGAQRHMERQIREWFQERAVNDG